MLHARGGSMDEQNSHVKKLKKSSAEPPVIDLTNDSDDFEDIVSETEESSDDEVLILGSRDVSRTNTASSMRNTSRTNTNPLMMGSQVGSSQRRTTPSITDAFQPKLNHQGSNSSQNTIRLDSLNPTSSNGSSSKLLDFYQKSEPKSNTNFTSNQIPPITTSTSNHLFGPSQSSSTINHIKPETTEQGLRFSNANINNQNASHEPLKRKAFTHSGCRFRSEKDVEERENELRKTYKDAIATTNLINKNLQNSTSMLSQTMASMNNLEVRKVSDSDPEYIRLRTSKNHLIQRVRHQTVLKAEREKYVVEAKSKLLSFINSAKPKLISSIRHQRAEEAQEDIRKAAAATGGVQLGGRPKQEAPHLYGTNPGLATFAGMSQGMNPRRHYLQLSDDDDDYDDYEDDENNTEHMMNLMQRNRALDNDNQHFDITNPRDMNIYNADTTQDLRSFLESIKTLEDSKEGESNTPEELTVNLLKHQRLGLHWLELNEIDEKKKGGILADAMGLGKTVQTISLMLARRSEDDTKKTNLIICPVAMMRQWESEIQTKVKESANFKCFIFHPSSGNKNRILSFKQLTKFDVVFISYQTLASEMKKHIHGFDLGEMGIRRINAKKEANSYFSPFFSKESHFYRVVLDEAQWIKNKSTKASMACSLIESEYRWCLSGTPMQNNIEEIYPLIRFLRIRPYCFEDKFRVDISLPLKSRNDNYDSYDKEKAMKKVRLMLKAILLRRSKDSVIDGEPILKLPEKNVIMNQIDMSENEAEDVFYKHLEGRSAIQVEKMLEKGLAKGNYSSILTLLLRLRQACLHSELVRIGERKQGFTFDDDGKVKKKATWDSMFQYAKDLKPEVVRRINALEATDDEKNRFNCPICLDSPPDKDWTMFFPCGHGLCKECIETFFEEFQEYEVNDIKVAKCTQCRLQVKETQLITYPIFDSVCNKKMSKEVVGLIHEKNQKELAKLNEDISKEVDSLKLSPKFAKALGLIKKIQSENPDDKIILFSQFTSLFDLFEKFLNQEHIESLRYDGSMSSDARNDTIKEFYKSSTKKLLMLSLKAGNVGLTLTCANHVIIMDPFWNPYVEEQAQDRSHRIGQQKPVTVYRLLTTGTVEDRIMALQQKKKELVESAMDEQGMKNVAGLGRREIEFLFNINR